MAPTVALFACTLICSSTTGNSSKDRMGRGRSGAAAKESRFRQLCVEDANRRSPEHREQSHREGKKPIPAGRAATAAREGSRGACMHQMHFSQHSKQASSTESPGTTQKLAKRPQKAMCPERPTGIPGPLPRRPLGPLSGLKACPWIRI